VPPVVHALSARSEHEARGHLDELLPDLLPVSRGERIVLKPSLGSPLPAAAGATTALGLLDAVARHVLDRGARPVVVESPSHSQRFNTVMELTGVRRWARELGLTVRDAQRLDSRKVVLRLDSGKKLKIRLPKVVLEADGIVNLPKLKTHVQAGATAGAKSFMGLLPHDSRMRFHRLGLDQPIRALARELAPRTRVTILDAMVAMEGDGPTTGRPLALDLVLASRDLAALDHVAVHDVAGLERSEVRGLLPCGVAHEVRLHGLRALPRRDFTRAVLPTAIRFHSLFTAPPVRPVLRVLDLGRRRLPQPVLLEERCTGCLECVPVCASGALDHPPKLIRSRCTGCGLCLEPEVCPEQALVPESGRQKLLRLLKPENLGWD